MKAKEESYLKTSLGHLNFIFTNKKFGNLSKKVGDISQYHANRKKLLVLASEDRGVVKLEAQHKDLIIDLTSYKKIDDETIISADGLIFDLSLVNAWIAPADCAIIVLFDESAKIVCMIHASRLTLPQNIISKSIDKYLKKINSDSTKISAFISPSIGSSHYVFEPDIAKPLFDSSWDQFIKSDLDNKLHIDIKARCIFELKAGGIDKIITSTHSTGDGNFFSQSSGRFDPNLMGRNGFLVFRN
jgi:copper oxidase (laccase) domain-containing protein